MAVHRQFYCPHCNAHLDYKVGYGHSSVGPAVAQCASCGETYKTGLSEWSEKSTAQRLGYYVLVPFRLLGAVLYGAFFGAFITSGISYIFLGETFNETLIFTGTAITTAIGIYFWWKELTDDTAGKNSEDQ